MFLVQHTWGTRLNCVFLHEDPRGTEGFDTKLLVDADARLSNPPDLHVWLDTAERPEPCVGRDPDDSTKYRVFKYPEELVAAGFLPVPGHYLVYERWEDYGGWNA